MINLCEYLNCPFRTPGTTGCAYYKVAQNCHLNYSNGNLRPEVSLWTKRGTPWPWAVAQDGSDLLPFEKAHAEWIKSTPVQKAIADQSKPRLSQAGFRDPSGQNFAEPGFHFLP